MGIKRDVEQSQTLKACVYPSPLCFFSFFVVVAVVVFVHQERERAREDCIGGDRARIQVRKIITALR